jgi:hypothetical protein
MVLVKPHKRNFKNIRLYLKMSIKRRKEAGKVGELAV